MLSVKLPKKGFTQHLFYQAHKDNRGCVGRRRKDAGFTLIETVLVLAISSLLALLLIGLYSNQQKRARFADAIESTVARLETVKSEVSSGFSTGSGTNPNRVFFGKAITFTPDSASYTVSSLTADIGDSINNITVENQSTTTMPWGVVFTNDTASSPAAVFTRKLTDAQLKTFLFPSGIDVTNESNYSITSGSQVVLHFSEELGNNNPLTAKISIDAASGHVESSYDN